MIIGYLKQGLFGGTDALIERFISWANDNGYYCIEYNNALNNNIKVDVLLMPTSSIKEYSLLRVRGKGAKRVIIWAMGHGAFRAAFFRSDHLIRHSKLLQPFIWFIDVFLSRLIDDRSLIFTDSVGLYSDLKNNHIEMLMSCSTETIFPIAIKKDPIVSVYSLYDGENPRLGWVGRVSEDFKLFPLVDLLKELNNLNFQNGFSFNKFYIVGTGDGMPFLQNFISSESFSFDIELISHIEPDLLRAFLKENVDLVFSMGTSSLDVAMSTIPSVIVKPYGSVDSKMIDHFDKYRYVFESVGYSLGEFNDIRNRVIQKNQNLGYILQQFIREGKKSLGYKSYEYAMNYDENIVFPALIERMGKVRKAQVSVFYYIGIAFFFCIKGAIKLFGRRCDS
jgi:hypothetical protein